MRPAGSTAASAFSYENSGFGHEVGVKPKLEGPSLLGEPGRTERCRRADMAAVSTWRLVPVADVFTTWR